MNWRHLCILSCVALTGPLAAEEEASDLQDQVDSQLIAQETIKIVQEASSSEDLEVGFAENFASKFWGF